MEFPKKIRLKKEYYKKHGVHPNVTGVYKLVTLENGQFYHGIISTPHLGSPTFAASIITAMPEEFEIIEK